MHEAAKQDLMGWYVERSGVYEFVRGGNVRLGRSEPPIPIPASDDKERSACHFDGKQD